MREILFRGKTFTGEWVEGVYYKQEEFYGDSEDASVIITSKETLDYDQALYFSEVIPETVGQYTGLYDKNGKKIFEGDIVKADNWLHSYMKIYTIVFEDGGFFAKYKDEDGWNFDHLANIEVIGNIHDNPELLKGE